MTAAGPGVSGAHRRSRRDTPRPAALARERGAVGRGSGTGLHHDRRSGRIHRATHGRGAVATQATALPAPRPTRTWWSWLLAGVAMLTLTGVLAWVLLGSSLFTSRSVQVAGTKELSADVVRAVAAVRLGTPMLRLDTQAIEARVSSLPRVASVQVRCQLDGTVRIEVTERTPVALVRRGDGVHLVDATGIDYAAVPVGPPGLPELQVARVGPRDAATVAALAVLTGLPAWLRVQARLVAARSPAGVVLRLGPRPGGTGREVRWGDAREGDRKAAVLGLLLTQPGKIYDVSSPALPTIA